MGQVGNWQKRVLSSSDATQSTKASSHAQQSKTTETGEARRKQIKDIAASTYNGIALLHSKTDKKTLERLFSSRLTRFWPIDMSSLLLKLQMKQFYEQWINKEKL